MTAANATGAGSGGSSGPALTAVLADDEPLARLHLRRLLEPQGVTVVGEAEDAAGTLLLTEAQRPALVFLDIQMPLLSGMQTAAALAGLDPAPLVVFVTGYSEHAPEAFERDALDYLLKPASPERVARTLMRARQRLAAGGALQRLAAAVAVERHAASLPPLRRVPVRTDYAVRLVRPEEILYAEAKQKAVFLHLESDEPEQRAYYTLTQLEALLPSETFLRIHDSYLVSLERIAELNFLGNHAYAVRLTSGETLPVGRTRYGQLRERLGL